MWVLLLLAGCVAIGLHPRAESQAPRLLLGLVLIVVALKATTGRLL